MEGKFCLKLAAFIIFIFLSFSAGMRVGTFIVDSIEEDAITAFETGGHLIKTVAHVTVDDPDLELIYADYDNDVAYYSYVGEAVFVEPGTKLYTVHGDELIVLTADVTGFTVDDADAIIPGQSGQSVLDTEGNCVGYVSSATDNGNVFCIWN